MKLYETLILLTVLIGTFILILKAFGDFDFAYYFSISNMFLSGLIMWGFSKGGKKWNDRLV